MCVKRLCRDPRQKKNVHIVIGFAYVKHYENGVAYTFVPTEYLPSE